MVMQFTPSHRYTRVKLAVVAPGGFRMAPRPVWLVFGVATTSACVLFLTGGVVVQTLNCNGRFLSLSLEDRSSFAVDTQYSRFTRSRSSHPVPRGICLQIDDLPIASRGRKLSKRVIVANRFAKLFNTNDFGSTRFCH